MGEKEGKGGISPFTSFLLFSLIFPLKPKKWREIFLTYSSFPFLSICSKQSTSVAIFWKPRRLLFVSFLSSIFFKLTAHYLPCIKKQIPWTLYPPPGFRRRHCIICCFYSLLLYFCCFSCIFDLMEFRFFVYCIFTI